MNGFEFAEDITGSAGPMTCYNNRLDMNGSGNMWFTEYILFAYLDMNSYSIVSTRVSRHVRIHAH